MLRLWLPVRPAQCPEGLSCHAGAGTSPHQCLRIPRFDQDTTQESLPMSSTVAGVGAANPPQYEGFGGTPGGTRIPILLIRSRCEVSLPARCLSGISV